MTDPTPTARNGDWRRARRLAELPTSADDNHRQQQHDVDIDVDIDELTEQRIGILMARFVADWRARRRMAKRMAKRMAETIDSDTAAPLEPVDPRGGRPSTIHQP